jgi:site-specific DNA recombinase
VKKRRRPILRLNAVVYCRVSTDEQVSNLSLPTQEQRCVNFCAQHGWPVTKVFREEGQSAKTTQRPVFQEMLQYCKDPGNGVGFVVVNDLSRFSRNTGDQIMTLAALRADGVMLRSVCEPIDETSSGVMVGTIFSAVHQFDNDRKSERTKVGMQQAAKLGRWPFKAPLGYINLIASHDGPNLAPDLDSAPLVRKAFDLAATGLRSKAEILREVTTLGLRTHHGKAVTAQTFQKLLVNPIYAGWIVIPEWDVKERGSFEPLVDQACFDRVQAVLEGRRPSLIGHQRNHPDFPLRLFVRCEHCGHPLTGSWSKGRRDRYAYYRCRNRSCLRVKVKREKLQALFLEWLEWMTPEQAVLGGFKDAVRAVWNQRQADAESLLTALLRKLEKIETRRTTLTNRWLDGQADQRTYAEQMTRLTTEIDEVQAELRDAKVEHLELEDVLVFAEKIITRPARLWVESTLDQRQRLQKTLFPNGVDFDGERFGTGTTPLFFSLLSGFSESDYLLASLKLIEPFDEIAAFEDRSQGLKPV